MQFDPMTALDIARRFARPRLAGSGEDERVAGEAAALLEGWGWRVQRQRFECSTAQGLFITAGVAACMVLAVLSLALRSASPWAAVAPAALLAAAIALAPPLYQAVQAASVRTAATPQAAWRQLGFRAGRRFALENLAAEWPDPPADPDRPHVILMAHYDSKSQRIPLVVRVACFALVIAGSLALAAFTLAGALVPGPALDSLARIAAGIVLVAGVPLLFLGAGNASPGAIDNASGLGTVLHLAECLAHRPDLLGRVRITLLLPNAEELGVLGSAAYLQQHEPALLQKAGTGGLYVLNFDGVGVDADMRLAGAQINRRAGGRMAGLVQIGGGRARVDGQAVLDGRPFLRSCSFRRPRLRRGVAHRHRAVHLVGAHAARQRCGAPPARVCPGREPGDRRGRDAGGRGFDGIQGHVMTTKTLQQLLVALPGGRVWPDGFDAGRVEITGITKDSRAVKPGDLFVAYAGVENDLHRFIPDAIRRGAAAVVCENDAWRAGEVAACPCAVVPNGREAFALLCAEWHDHPSRSLVLVGVTGTDGKTTTSNLIFNILQAAGHKTGIISTVNAVIGEQVLDTGLHTTTPDADEVQAYLARMRDARMTHCVLEVTSHGLAQHRVDGCDFDVAVVTNITHEHLDLHGSREAYRAAKARLFEMLGRRTTDDGRRMAKARVAPTAVLNADDVFLLSTCARSRLSAGSCTR